MNRRTIAWILVTVLLGAMVCASTAALAETEELHVLAVHIGSKTYDGTRAPQQVRITTEPGLRYAGDVGVSFTILFDDKNAGTDKRIKITDMGLYGSDAGRYNLVWDAPTVYYADIYPQEVGVAIAEVDNKVYDGTTDAKATIVLYGILKEDEASVSVTADAEFESPDAEEYKTVYINNIQLKGDQSVLQNYDLVDSRTTTDATIHPKEISVTGFSVKNKVYDGTSEAQVEAKYTEALSGEDIKVTADADFWDSNWSDYDAEPGKKNVKIHDVELSGTGNTDNYSLVVKAATETTAEILPKEVKVKGILALDKKEDGNTTAVLDCSGATVTGLLDDEEVEVAATGAFENAEPGINKKVLIKEIKLLGDEAAHYKLAAKGQQTHTYATVIEDPERKAPAIGDSFTYKDLKFKVTAKKEVTFIGLKKAKSLASVTIPASFKYKKTTYTVAAIAANAMKGDTKIKKLTIGANIKSIGKNAFSGCKNLKTITVKTKKLTGQTVKSNAFAKINSKATFKCPKEKLDEYAKLFVKKGAPKNCKFK